MGQASHVPSLPLTPCKKIKALKQPREEDTEPLAWLGTGQRLALLPRSTLHLWKMEGETRCHGDRRAA